MAEVGEVPFYRYVKVAPELIEILSKDWSRPVQVRIESEDGCDLVLMFREAASDAETKHRLSTPENPSFQDLDPNPAAGDTKERQD